MISEKMMQLGKKSSIIREIFEYGKKRKAEIGAENVFDFSLGNPSVPAPQKVTDVMTKLINEVPAEVLHGYTSGPGDMNVRTAIAEYINNKFGVNANAGLIYMTCGAAASLTITLNAIAEEGDEVIAFAPFFPEYRVFTEQAGAKFVVVPCKKEDLQIDFDALSNAINENTKAIIPIDLAGVRCDYDKIFEIVERKKQLFKPADFKEGRREFLLLTSNFGILTATSAGELFSILSSQYSSARSFMHSSTETPSSGRMI